MTTFFVVLAERRLEAHGFRMRPKSGHECPRSRDRWPTTPPKPSRPRGSPVAYTRVEDRQPTTAAGSSPIDLGPRRPVADPRWKGLASQSHANRIATGRKPCRPKSRPPRDQQK